MTLAGAPYKGLNAKKVKTSRTKTKVSWVDNRCPDLRNFDARRTGTPGTIKPASLETSKLSGFEPKKAVFNN